MLIYPNPVKETINLLLERAYKNVSLRIYDISGRLIISESFSGGSHRVNSEVLPQGVYILTLSNEELNVNLKFVKE